MMRIEILVRICCKLRDFGDVGDTEGGSVNKAGARECQVTPKRNDNGAALAKNTARLMVH